METHIDANDHVWRILGPSHDDPHGRYVDVQCETCDVLGQLDTLTRTVFYPVT
jgi:hypothetical protein